MIPILYATTETLFRSQGLCRLPDCIDASVTEIRNGEYTCQFTYPISGEGYEQIKLGRIIGCPHDASGDVQPFAIYRREANLDGTVTFYAQHLSYELNYVTQKPFSTSGGAAGLFSYLDSNRTTAYRIGGRNWESSKSPYRFSTDIVSDVDYTLLIPTAMRSMLGGMQNSVLDVFGGEFEWDRYNVILHADRGKDNGAVIRYGGNLTGAKQTGDNSAAYGTVVPYWTDNEGNVTANLGYYSQGSTEEYFPWKATPLDLSKQFETSPTTAQASEAAEAFLAANSTWLPFENIEVNFEPWSDAEISAESERLQNVCLCDYVRVDIVWTGVSLKAKVTKTVWNVLTDRYSSIELGDLNPSYGDVVKAGSGGAATTVPFNRQALIDEILATVYDNCYKKTEMLDLIYPVGSIFISTANVNPGSLLGGTWAAYAKGRTLVGDGDGTDINGTTLRFTAGNSGGEYYHTLTADEIPEHTHQYRRENSSGSSSSTCAAKASTRWSYAATTSAGGGERHYNIQPYVSVYIWRRTA